MEPAVVEGVKADNVIYLKDILGTSTAEAPPPKVEPPYLRLVETTPAEIAPSDLEFGFFEVDGKRYFMPLAAVPLLTEQVTEEIAAEEICEPEPAEGPVAELLFAHNVIGPRRITKNEIVLNDDEWILHQRPFTSQFYDTRAQAAAALKSCMQACGLNYAYRAKIEAHTFTLGDFTYKRHYVTAVLALYYQEVPHHDEEMCCAEARRINDEFVPSVKAAFAELIEVHQSERNRMLMPSVQPTFTDGNLLSGAIVSFVMLVGSFACMMSGMGAFG